MYNFTYYLCHSLSLFGSDSRPSPIKQYPFKSRKRKPRIIPTLRQKRNTPSLSYDILLSLSCTRASCDVRTLSHSFHNSTRSSIVPSSFLSLSMSIATAHYLLSSPCLYTTCNPFRTQFKRLQYSTWTFQLTISINRFIYTYIYISIVHMYS